MVPSVNEQQKRYQWWESNSAIMLNHTQCLEKAMHELVGRKKYYIVHNLLLTRAVKHYVYKQTDLSVEIRWNRKERRCCVAICS